MANMASRNGLLNSKNPDFSGLADWKIPPVHTHRISFFTSKNNPLCITKRTQMMQNNYALLGRLFLYRGCILSVV